MKLWHSLALRAAMVLLALEAVVLAFMPLSWIAHWLSGLFSSALPFLADKGYLDPMELEIAARAAHRARLKVEAGGPDAA